MFSSFAKSHSCSVVTRDVSVMKMGTHHQAVHRELLSLGGKMFYVSFLVTFSVFYLNHFLLFLSIHFNLRFEVI